PRPAARLGVFEHPSVARRIADRRDRAAADHEVDALGLAGVVVIQHEPRFLGQERLAILAVTVLRAGRRADDLLWGNSVDALGVDSHEVLAAAGDDVGPGAVGPEVLQHFLHWLVGQLGVGALPARVPRSVEARRGLGDEGVRAHAGQRGTQDV